TALLPVIGTALFIRYGTRQRITGIYWWAELTPSTRMGDWSYAIYLWHWPLIIAAGYLLDPLTWPYKLGLIALTFALSAASQKLIEDPLRKAKPFKIPKRAFTLMASNIAIIAALTFFIPTLLSPNTNEDVAIDECTGANALLTNCQDQGLEGQPLASPTQVADEKSEDTYPECFIPKGETDFDRSDCSLGADPDTSDYTIAIFGSSHARMWLPMLDKVGRENNWNIQGYTKSACSPVPLPKASPESTGEELETAQGCDDFVFETAEELKNDPEIDVIATASLGGSETHYMEDGDPASTDEKIEAIDTMWQEWHDAGKEVVTIGEVPHFDDIEAPTCVEENNEDVAENCSVPFSEAIDPDGTFQRLTADAGNAEIEFYDPAAGLCNSGTCYSMVGNLITRYDHHHLSADFATSYSDNFSKFMHENVLD
ncbi:acyltransferase family protein, partial [Yaniella flava]|uniref:acyltransferase family protein n=1 Tax=Yaniella flava TaxID=287930 RepID=UPI0031CE21EF